MTVARAASVRIMTRHFPLFCALFINSNALYATGPYIKNAYSNPSANNTGRPFDATDCLAEGFVCELPPRNEDRPLAAAPVYLHLDVVNIPEIDELRGTYIVDFFFHMAWRDDRVNCDAALLNATLGEICQDVADESSWVQSTRQFFPRLDILNSVDKAFDGSPLELVVKQKRPKWLVNRTFDPGAPEGPDNFESLSSGSWVSAFCRQRLEISAAMQLRPYPFDVQNLSLTFQANDYYSDAVRLVASYSNLQTIRPPSAKPIPGWTVKSTFLDFATVEYTSEEVFSTLTFTVQVTRSPSKLVSRYVLGVSFLVFMGIFAILLEPHNPNRQTMQQASFLGVVAWQYVLVSSTPSMSELTVLDKFFLVAFGHLFAAFIFCCVKHSFDKSIDAIIRVNKLHAKGGAELSPVSPTGEEALPAAIPGLISMARAIIRGLPAYVSGQGWAELDLHQRLDLLAILTFVTTYTISAAVSLSYY